MESSAGRIQMTYKSACPSYVNLCNRLCLQGRLWLPLGVTQCPLSYSCFPSLILHFHLPHLDVNVNIFGRLLSENCSLAFGALLIIIKLLVSSSSHLHLNKVGTYPFRSLHTPMPVRLPASLALACCQQATLWSTCSASRLFSG